MGIGDPLSLFARYWINQTHRGTSFIHTLSPLNMTARPWLYKVCSSYCFGAKQCFWSGYMIYLTQGVLGTDFSSVFSVMGRHGQPDPAYQDKQHPLRNKQSSFFFDPFAVFKKSNVWNFRFLSGFAHFMPGLWQSVVQPQGMVQRADVKQEETDLFIALQVSQVPMLARHFLSESFWV